MTRFNKRNNCQNERDAKVKEVIDKRILGKICYEGGAEGEG